MTLWQVMQPAPQDCYVVHDDYKIQIRKKEKIDGWYLEMKFIQAKKNLKSWNLWGDKTSRVTSDLSGIYQCVVDLDAERNPQTAPILQDRSRLKLPTSSSRLRDKNRERNDWCKPYQNVA